MSELIRKVPLHSIKGILSLFAISVLVISCGREVTETGDETHRISAVMDSFHVAAARADYDAYFRCFAEEAVFIGTDATERWDKQSFMEWTKPYFDRGRAWSFSALERHVSIGKDGATAWCDELLDTQMKICRGSGVLVKENGEWKITHYVLSMTVPNDLTDSVVTLKSAIEDGLIQKHAEKGK